MARLEHRSKGYEPKDRYLRYLFHLFHLFAEKKKIMPAFSLYGDHTHLHKNSTNMIWWKGQDIECIKETMLCDTIYNVLDKLCRMSERTTSAPMRMPFPASTRPKASAISRAWRGSRAATTQGAASTPYRW